ncbi:hypothetical protein [Uliginosibacterium gangwonense]|uniref:hypothetical protein n=1 Tax=Uliginosibacterium gangwonense TaxID=392736 RepID=UPI000382BD30|nr:hypothetical protein [Uliginosibacterium gangwonense]
MINKNVLSRRGWWIFIALVIIARLYLSGDRDIIATNSPHDEYWYIHAAFNKIWGGSYNEMSFMHLPTYSAWLDFLYILGMPARLAIDVFWLLAVGYLAFAIQRFTRIAWLGGVVFAFLAFHPYIIIVFDRALAETFLTVVSAAVLAAAIELWNCRDGQTTLRGRVALIIYVFGFAVAYHTRKEGIVLAAPLILLAGWSLIDRPRWWRGVDKPALVVPLLLAPLFSTFLLGALLSGINYLKWGVWARYELAAPGYERAVAALNSIDIGRTPLQITVTKEMIKRAYQESPTFSELKPAMEGATGQQWIAISSAFTAVPGEIGNGWFYWALRDVAAHAGWHASAKVADRKYGAVADELELAFAAGRLKKKFMLSSFLDPDFEKWAPSLPSSLYNVSQLVVQPSVSSLASPSENASPTQFDEFVRLAGRRAPPSRLKLSGWVVAPAGSLIGLGGAQSTFAWQRLGDSRPDVPGAYAFAVSSMGIEAPTELHLQLPDGQQKSVMLTALKAGATANFGGSMGALLGIDSLESNSKSLRADRWISKLCTVYEWVGYLFCLATVGGLLVMAVRRKLSGVALMLVLMVSAIVARVALFGILDASSWSGVQARYILPIIPFFACMGAFGTALMEGFNKKA